MCNINLILKSKGFDLVPVKCGDCNVLIELRSNIYGVVIKRSKIQILSSNESKSYNGNIHILDTFEIEAYPLPDLFLGSDTLICAGNSLILHAGQHDSYLWNDNSTSSTLIPDFSVSGQYAYSVTVTNNYGCIAFDEINIEVQDCASFEDVAMEDIMFYPNPFREVIYSNVNLKDYDIEIYDINGRKIPFCLDDEKIHFNSIKNQSILKIYRENNLIQLIVR